MVACARDACPAIVRRDCEKWLSDLDASQPTLRPRRARDPKGNDLPATRVSLDGSAFVARLDGKPVAVDPGEHVLRYEASGAAAVEQRVVVRVNEKNRMLIGRSSCPQSAILAPAPATPAQESAPARDAGRSSGHVPAAAWVFPRRHRARRRGLRVLRPDRAERHQQPARHLQPELRAKRRELRPDEAPRRGHFARRGGRVARGGSLVLLAPRPEARGRLRHRAAGPRAEPWGGRPGHHYRALLIRLPRCAFWSHGLHGHARVRGEGRDSHRRRVRDRSGAGAHTRPAQAPRSCWADRQVDVAEEVAVGIRSSGGRARATELDVRQLASMARVVAETEARSGKVDLFFNNAGTGVGERDGLSYTARDWDDVLRREPPRRRARRPVRLPGDDPPALRAHREHRVGRGARRLLP